jgi:hypothetical protein
MVARTRLNVTLIVSPLTVLIFSVTGNCPILYLPALVTLRYHFFSWTSCITLCVFGRVMSTKNCKYLNVRFNGDTKHGRCSQRSLWELLSSEIWRRAVLYTSVVHLWEEPNTCLNVEVMEKMFAVVLGWPELADKKKEHNTMTLKILPMFIIYENNVWNWVKSQ